MRRRVRRRRLRRQAGGRLRGARRRRAGADRRAGRSGSSTTGTRSSSTAAAAARRRRRSGSARRKDGTLTAIEADAVVAMGQGGWIFPVLNPARTLYRCADVRALTFPAKTNLRAQNAFRAPGVMEGVTAFEQAMDELALALGIDPLELRRRNHVDVDQVSGLPVLEQAAPRLLRPCRRARRLGAPRRAPRAAGRRAPARDGVRHPDLVGRRRAAVARDRTARRGRARARRDRDPGHRHRAR